MSDTSREVPRRVAVVGVGDMGGAIAGTMLRAGQDVIVYDTRPEVVAEFRRRGVHSAPSAKAAAEAADAVLLVVSTDAQLLSVARELAGAHPAPSIVAVQSTVLPATVQEVQSILAESGIATLDAPVTGGSAAAQNAVLTTFVGGRPEDLEYIRPVFESYCRSIRHVGDIGAGQLTKITNNAMSIVNSLVALEALALAEAAGLKEEDVRAAIVEGGTGGSRALAGTDAEGFGTPWERRRDGLGKIVYGNGSAGTGSKDLGHAVTLAEAGNTPAPLLRAALDLMRRK
ncbi:NAD(P)-dependent oxidoreductase [Amycolatopsis sp. GM8]|uniref:NAD(P)-dependent oxidoreductase n=1 Tax=Amycolatopsis sp. GM8 TaxID=2896530 RepID=UPI001F00F3B6|nr:NAD(P)-binding domain-containing protein [Amycolatopsis sp. GM8]